MNQDRRPSIQPATETLLRPSVDRAQKTRRRGGALALLLAAAVAISSLSAIIWYSFLRDTDIETIDAVLKPVARGEFVAKVLDQGEIQSAENVEIKCMVGSRNGSISVIDLVPEGEYVKGGDWLVTLDSTAFEKELEQQRMAVGAAQTEVIRAEASLETAKAAKNEYLKGTYIEAKKTIENEKFDAEQELQQADAFLAHSEKLFKKGFYSQQELTSDNIAVERATNKVELQIQRLDVLENITLDKEIIQLDSEIAAADGQHKNALEAKMIEDRQLSEIEQQLEYCRITVPEGVEGEVVYHKEFDRRGGSEWVLEPGAEVRERQVLIKLPNPNEMEVKVLINEQSITAIREGFPATISVDALTSKPLVGMVTKVNSYAEQGGFMGSSSVREYAVFVKIHNPPKQLIPGMNASVTIQTEYQDNVLQAPLQCIYSANDTNFVLRHVEGEKPETLPVEIVGENSQSVWIESGVDEGDLLVMDPGFYKDLMDLPELQKESQIKLPDGMAITSADSGLSESPAVDGAGKSARATELAQRSPEATGGPDRREDRDRQRGGSGGGGSGGGFSIDSMIDRTMERYDVDGDGNIDADEQKEFDERASRLSDADSDGDGAISRDEIKTAMEAMMKRFQQQSGGQPGGGK